jgi:hypothetical protein
MCFTEEDLGYTYSFQSIPALSCINCNVLCLILKSLIHIELVLVMVDRHGFFFSVSQKHFFEEANFYLLYAFGNFVKNKLGADGWIRIRILSSVPLVFKSVFVPISCWFYCYIIVFIVIV